MEIQFGSLGSLPSTPWEEKGKDFLSSLSRLSRPQPSTLIPINEINKFDDDSMSPSKEEPPSNPHFPMSAQVDPLHLVELKYNLFSKSKGNYSLIQGVEGGLGSFDDKEIKPS
jgi:hypothetical protein